MNTKKNNQRKTLANRFGGNSMQNHALADFAGILMEYHLSITLGLGEI